MKKLYSFLSLMMLSVMILSAQSDVVPVGGTATGSGGTVTYTVGQIAVQTYSNGTFTISEGVQQPYEIQIIGVDDYPGITLNAMVYPNPTIGNVQLTINNEQLEGEVKVFDMNGKFLFSKRIERQNTEIPMSDLAAGTYFVTLSGRFPISSSLVWFGGHLSCSFICWLFLCLFILFKLLSLGCPFCILAVCGVLFIVAFPRCVWVCTGGLSRFPG